MWLLIILSFFAVCACAGLSQLILISIQPGQIFGAWQNVLNKIRLAKNDSVAKCAKFLGDCELCTCHFLCFIGWWGFVLFTHDLISMQWYKWIIWYFVHIGTSTSLALKIIKTK